jgi:hypothetical protein
MKVEINEIWDPSPPVVVVVELTGREALDLMTFFGNITMEPIIKVVADKDTAERIRLLAGKFYDECYKSGKMYIKGM